MLRPNIAVAGMWSKSVHGMRFSGNAVAVQVLRSVARAGGQPLTLFAGAPGSAVERLTGFAGLLLPGGFDVSPARYGESVHSATQVADEPVQDDFEAELLRAAVSLGLPVLAICRGFQLLNVERGGSLCQDIAADSVHRNGLHEVELAAGSRLREVLERPRVTVSSYHHQAVARVGEGLRAVGVASDGTVEALEPVDSHERVLAVQWHPEDTSEDDPVQQAVFDWLVCEGRK